MDGRYALPDENASEGQNRDEPARSRVQHEKGNQDPRDEDSYPSDRGLARSLRVLKIHPLRLKNPSQKPSFSHSLGHHEIKLLGQRLASVRIDSASNIGAGVQYSNILVRCSLHQLEPCVSSTIRSFS